MPVIDLERGTSERLWVAWAGLRALPEFEWGVPGRVVAVAPHPDDETLAIGGTLSMLCRAGFAIEVVALTDGEGSHPRSPTYSPTELAAIRCQEQANALELLGCAQARLTRFGLIDGAVGAARDLAARLAARLVGAAFCLAPFRRDGHPDHDAAGVAAARACEASGVKLCEYPVWAWHWARPASDDLPWSRARRISLDAEACRAKARAVIAHRTQFLPLSKSPGDQPALPSAVLDHFARDFEVVFA